MLPNQAIFLCESPQSCLCLTTQFAKCIAIYLYCKCSYICSLNIFVFLQVQPNTDVSWRFERTQNNLGTIASSCLIPLHRRIKWWLWPRVPSLHKVWHGIWWLVGLVGGLKFPKAWENIIIVLSGKTRRILNMPWRM